MDVIARNSFCIGSALIERQVDASIMEYHIVLCEFGSFVKILRIAEI